MNELPWLSAIVFTPWIGALLLAGWRGARPTVARTVALAFSVLPLLLTAGVWWGFDRADPRLQFVERQVWIEALNVHYHVGIDGMGLLLLGLTGLLSPLALFAAGSLRSPRVFGALFLALQGAALGVFVAVDFVHWFLFWELSLIPAFFLIKLWGGRHATAAAYQFVVYTLGGSAFMLLAFAALYAITGTMNFETLADLASDGTLHDALNEAGGFWPQALFFGVLLGLAVKVPLWPFHTWLPAAYAEAPAPVSMFLTGVLSKMGVYGFLRILWPLFPAELHQHGTWLLGLALAGVVLGAFAALRQTEVKRMIAYSSLNHLSYCLLALFAVAVAGPVNAPASAAALSGCLLQVFNHGLSAAALFFVAGALEQRKAAAGGTGPLLLADFGGVRGPAPILAGLAGVALFSSLGLPGLNGFVGEFLIFRGVFGLVPWAAAVACLGLFATAFFLLTFWQRVFHGPPRGLTTASGADLQGREYAVLVPLALLMLVLGLLPQLLTGVINPLIVAWTGGGAP